MESSYAYSFSTTWQIKAPIALIWPIIYDAEKWPQWWSSVKEVTKIREGDENGIGMVMQYKWKGFLPYNLIFSMKSVKIDNLKTMEGIAYGELIGEGKWYFSEQDGITTLRCQWNVNTNKKWMNKPGWLLKTIFKWNHNYTMRKGAKGLAKLLNADLLNY